MQFWLHFGLTAFMIVATTETPILDACATLADRYKKTQPARWASFRGVPHPLVVWATPEPQQAALAHLMTMVLRHPLGYRDVRLLNLSTADNANALALVKNISGEYNPEQFLVAPGIRICSADGEQKAVASDSMVRAHKTIPLRLRLQLTPRAQADPRCNIAPTDWLHFTNFTPGECDLLLYEGFKNESIDLDWPITPKWCLTGKHCAVVLVPDGRADVAKALLQLINKRNLHLTPVPLSLYSNSFYNNHSRLKLSDCDSSLEFPSEYLFIQKHLGVYAKRAYLTMIYFATFATKKNLVSELLVNDNSSSSDLEDKACKYLLNNEKQMSKWLQPESDTVFIRYYLCDDDPYAELIKNAMTVVELIVKQEVSYTPVLQNASLSCYSEAEITFVQEFKKFTSDLNWPVTGALVAPKGNASAKYLAYEQETLLLLYETQQNASEQYPVFLATVNWDSMITAAGAWLKNEGYQKVALAMENRTHQEITKIRDYLSELNINVQSPSKSQVLIVDATPHAVEKLVCDISVKYTNPPILLLLGAWTPKFLSCASQKTVSLWTVSGSWPGGDLPDNIAASTGADAVLHRRLSLVLDDVWPPQLVPLVEAVLTAAHALDSLRRRYPQFINDLHGDNVTSRLLSEIVMELNTSGVLQSLRYDKHHKLSEPLVFVTYWENGVNPSLETVLRIMPSPKAPYKLWVRNRSSSPFLIGATSIALLIAFLCIIGIRYWWPRYRKVTQPSKWPIVAQLAALELRREEFEVHEKIGEGSSGRVFLALWRGRHATHVAVKTPVAGTGGAPALLWEARVMAPLQHPNVVRLLGIVTGDALPFIVLEYAVQGDLRSYLAKTERSAGGLKYVSAVLLTRLAREAAAALVYLATQKVVHRDVRAANYLVDEHHVLKLADFGMARELPGNVTGAADVNQYLCRRRALFPIPWMAPESLKRGVFSPASDMWSYGVLLLEIATLGARPYGLWAPHVVLCHVFNGGTPLLPLDASPDMSDHNACAELILSKEIGILLLCHTRLKRAKKSMPYVGALVPFCRTELTRLCWARQANRRITAGQTLAFLERRPSAITACEPVEPVALPPTPPPPPLLLVKGKSESHLERTKEFIFRNTL